MKKLIATLSLLLNALVPLPRAQAVELPIGEVVQQEYKGAVAASLSTGRSHAIYYADSIFALDTVRTDAAGSTELRFLDDTTIQIGGGAEVRLDNFIYDPSTFSGGANISFAVGAFRYVGGKMATEEDVRLNTPTTTMAIRGTELVVYVWSDGQTEVDVISGAVEVYGCGGKKATLARSGMQVTVLPNCSTQLAAARVLPSGFEALRLPEQSDHEPRRSRGNDDDRGGRGDRSSAKEPKGPSNSGGSGSNGGTGPHI